MKDFFVEDILEKFEDYTQPVDQGPSFMNQEPRNNYFGGGKVLQLLKNFNKTGAVKGLEEKLIKQYKSEGMGFIEAIKKAQTEANGVRYEGRMKIIDNAMKETNVMSDDYVDLLDMKIKLEDPDFAKQYVNFSENLKNKTRSRYDSDWAEANFGEEYGTKLDQARVREINESIDPNITERSLVDDIDDMNIANTDEFFGRKKNATGGLQRNMAQGGRIGFKGGSDAKTGMGFQKGHNFGRDLKGKPSLNVQGKNQYANSMTVKEIQAIIDANPDVEYPKNFVTKGLLPRRQIDNNIENLVFKKQGTPVADPAKQTARNTKRNLARKNLEGRGFAVKSAEGYQLHHIMPLAGNEKLNTGDYAVVSKEMNAKMSKYDRQINKLVNEAYGLDFNKTENLKRLDEINNSLFDILKTVKKDLPKEYKGLLGFNKLTPVLDTFDDKGKQILFAEPQGIDYKKSIAGSKGVPVKDVKTSDIQKLVNEAPKSKFINRMMDFCPNKLAGGGSPGACSLKEAKAGMKKQIDLAKKASKDGKIPKKFGKLRSFMTSVFGVFDAPIELLLVLPEITAGNTDAAIQNSTLGWFTDKGEFNLEKLKDSNFEAYQFLKDKQARKEYTEAEETLDSLQPFLDKAQKEGTLNQVNPEILEQYRNANNKRESIIDEYQEYGYSSDDPTQSPLTGKVATQNYLKDKVKTDWQKRQDKLKKQSDADYEASGLVFDKDPNQKQLQYEDVYKAPTDLKSFIEQKGELGKDTMLQYGVRDEANRTGVGDIFDNYIQGADNKDERDLYSELPIEYANQLAALEKEELNQGLKSKGNFMTRAFRNLLESQQMDTDQLYAKGGLANLMKKYYD